MSAPAGTAWMRELPAANEPAREGVLGLAAPGASADPIPVLLSIGRVEEGAQAGRASSRTSDVLWAVGLASGLALAIFLNVPSRLPSSDTPTGRSSEKASRAVGDGRFESSARASGTNPARRSARSTSGAIDSSADEASPGSRANLNKLDFSDWPFPETPAPPPRSQAPNSAAGGSQSAAPEFEFRTSAAPQRPVTGGGPPAAVGSPMPGAMELRTASRPTGVQFDGGARRPGVASFVDQVLIDNKPQAAHERARPSLY